MPDADDPPCETEGRGVDSCSVSSAIFFWDSDSWPSSVCPSLLDPWLRASRLRQPVHDGFVRQPQPVVRLPLSLPSTGLRSILSRHASLCACCLPWPVLRYRQPGQPSLRPHCSKSAQGRSSLLCFSTSTSPGSRGTISAGLSIPTWMSNALSLPSGNQGVDRTWRMLSASHLSDSGTLLMFADLVLIASPCSVTSTTSSACQQISSSCWLGHVQDRLPKFQDRCVVPSSMQVV